MRRKFDEIVNRNLIKWKRLNKRLSTERLGKKLIEKRIGRRGLVEQNLYLASYNKLRSLL